MKLPKTPRAQVILNGLPWQEPLYPCDPGCANHRCRDLEDEVVERVLQDRFDDPWPPQSWQHWSPLDGGRGILIMRVHHHGQ
jgi:hypothetical protein